MSSSINSTPSSVSAAHHCSSIDCAEPATILQSSIFDDVQRLLSRQAWWNLHSQIRLRRPEVCGCANLPSQSTLMLATPPEEKCAALPSVTPDSPYVLVDTSLD